MTRTKIRPSVTVPNTSIRKRLRSRDWPHPPRRDPHTRVISQLLELAGPESSVIATSSTPWASATFIGARHKIVLQMKGKDHVERAESLTASLPDAEFSITGHIVADVCIDEWHMTAGSHGESETSGSAALSQTVLHLTVLTVEDW